MVFFIASVRLFCPVALTTFSPLPILLLRNRHKRVLVAACLPAEPAMREHGRELHLPEADQLPPGLPGQ